MSDGSEAPSDGSKGADQKTVAVLGAGSWGTALAHHLARVGHRTILWGRDPELLRVIGAEHRNPRYFPDLPLSPEITVEADILKAVRDADAVVFAVPSGVLHEVLKNAKPNLRADAILVSTAKGLEDQTLQPMSAVLRGELGDHAQIAVLSGPSFAREVILGLPTAVTIAARSLETASAAAAFFHIDYFRVYTSRDVVGVEFGGIVKNVIALACGVVEGVGMGANARAALITRGLLEMQRITLALGGEAVTVTGLSGLGDLLLTATGDLSRNRQVGLRLGKGEKLTDIVSHLGQVAEAVRVTPKVAELARRHNVKAPIIEEVDRILSGQSSAAESVRKLLSRAPVLEAS
ncbi:MAG: NAD(P)H-dependent glycerol-3-phosphate dehydrogenase [Bdellovibrionota bacterium]